MGNKVAKLKNAFVTQRVSVFWVYFPQPFHSSVSLIWKLLLYNFWEDADSCHNHKGLCLGSCATCLFLSCSEAPGALWHWCSVVHPLTPSFSLQTCSTLPLWLAPAVFVIISMSTSFPPGLSTSLQGSIKSISCLVPDRNFWAPWSTLFWEDSKAQMCLPL